MNIPSLPALPVDALGLVEQANHFVQVGQQERAVECWRRLIELVPDHGPALNGLGTYYLARGNLSNARHYLALAVASSPELAIAHANLSRVYSAQGDLASALESINQAIHAEPAAWGAHMEKARLLESLGRQREAASAWTSALAYMPHQVAQSPNLKEAVARAHAAIAENHEQLRDFLEDRLHGVLQGGNHRELERFAHCMDIITGRRSFVTARPLVLPFPRLPAIPFFHREDYAWTRQVEDAFPDILNELQNLLSKQQDFVPYVQTPAGQPMGQFATLDRKLDWGAYFLWKNGKRIDAQADLCQLTEAALLNHAPLNTVPNRAPVAFFSALKPGTHIPPHNGATNTRLTVHLPLIVPPDCALRVGEETHVWKPGELVMFDDTIQHEAWNKSDQLRVVLIFDVWHPMLTDLERQLVAHTMETIMAYYGSDADLGEL